MTDNLRTRIAAALKTDIRDQAYTLVLLEEEEPYSVLIDGTVNLLEVADAVIRELGLTRRTGQGPFSNQVWYQTDWTIE